jgi:transcriptional regulator CtsR
VGISDMIARFITEMLEEANGIAELQRAELAARFNCVPSQINYVISTRFSPEHGYIVESRRGGGGYIRIKRVKGPQKQRIMHIVNAIGNQIDTASASAFVTNAYNSGLISRNVAKLIMAAVSDNALRPLQGEQRDEVRANLLKHLLIYTNS